MTSTTEQEQGSPDLATTRASMARRRRNLLLPILLLATISLLAVGGLLFWSAGSLDQGEARIKGAMLSSVVQLRADRLRQLVIDYAWWDEAVVSYGVTLDERWVREGLAKYLHATFNISAGWILSPKGEIELAFDHGNGVGSGTAEQIPAGLEALIETARQARSLGDVPPASFVVHNGELLTVAASVIAPLEGVVDLVAAPRNVLVFLRPVDLEYFQPQSEQSLFEDLRFVEGGIPYDYLGWPVRGFDGQLLGHLIWDDYEPGSDLMWSAAPLLLTALLAIGLLLVLAMRRVAMVISDEGRLSISLYQEKQRRTQKSRFVSMVSHELRTPLQAINTSADLLERFGDQMDNRERREEARTIRYAAATLGRIVDDVLVMGQNESFGEAAVAQPIDLARFCQALWREVTVALQSKQKLELDDRIGRPVIVANELALHTVLSNLLQNAVKYSGGQGPVRVAFEQLGSEYCVRVIDYGPGIEESQREAIFQPYWRAESVEAIPGTGLGLAVARSAAQSMGGDLVLKCAGRSSGTDLGTCFLACWPVAD